MHFAGMLALHIGIPLNYGIGLRWSGIYTLLCEILLSACVGVHSGSF